MSNELTEAELFGMLAQLSPEKLQQLREMTRHHLTQPETFDEIMDSYQKLT